MREIIQHGALHETDVNDMVRLIADRLLNDGSELTSRPADSDRVLLERALAYVAEAERRIADQDRRIAYLQDLSITDELTGLLNRRGFNEQLRRVLASAKRYGHHGLLLYCDLDDFKRINDEFGHAAGDGALRHTADLLSHSVRTCDLVARLGGDEFAVALVQTNWQDGTKRARTLQWLIEREPFRFGTLAIPLRVSIGDQPFGPDDSVDDLICRADMAMYYCKRRKGSAVSYLAAE